MSRANAVLQLPGLTYRQKEVLMVLRSMGPAPLPRLNRALKMDRSNLRRRLVALVHKGYVVKFLHPRGTHYFAPAAQVDKSLHSSIREQVKARAHASSRAPENLPHRPHLPEQL